MDGKGRNDKKNNRIGDIIMEKCVICGEEAEYYVQTIFRSGRWYKENWIISDSDDKIVDSFFLCKDCYDNFMKIKNN